MRGRRQRPAVAAVPKLLEREWDERPPAQRSWRRIEALGRDGQIAAVAQGLAWLSYRTFELARPAPPLDAALGELKKWLEGRVAADGLEPRDILGMSRDAQSLVLRGLGRDRGLAADPVPARPAQGLSRSLGHAARPHRS